MVNWKDPEQQLKLIGALVVTSQGPLNYKAMGALLGVTGNDVELQIRKYRQAGEQLKQKVEAMKDDAATIAAAAPAPRARAKNSKVKDEEMEDYPPRGRKRLRSSEDDAGSAALGPAPKINKETTKPIIASGQTERLSLTKGDAIYQKMRAGTAYPERDYDSLI